MPKFAANLSMQFTEVDFLDRFKAAAKAGYKGVEFLFPYAYDKDELAAKLAENKLQQVLFNMPPGDWAKGERGLACLPDRTGEFRDAVGKAIDYAKALKCPRLHAMAGLRPQGVAEDKLRATYVANLKAAAAETAKAGIMLVIEAINFRDMPGFYLNYSKQALEIIAEVGAPNLKFQYDIYHMQRMEGELANTIKANVAAIGHMQLADNPGRHEPGTGEINYPFLFKAIDEAGYDGWIGCEYVPAAGTEAGLGWFAPYK
jgi:hydroxypyruvate isomerase